MDPVSHPFRRHLAGAALATLLAIAPAGAALADSGTELLAALAGNWTARGMVRESAASAAEAVVCRTSSSLARQGTQLKNTGKCAGAQAKVNVAGALSYSTATGLLTGNLLTTGDGQGSTSTTGRPSSTGVQLKTVSSDARGAVVARGTVDIALTGDTSYTLRVVLTEAASGKRYTAADMTFTRR